MKNKIQLWILLYEDWKGIFLLFLFTWHIFLAQSFCECAGFYLNFARKSYFCAMDSIKSFNDRINLQDVRDVYLPLTNLIGIYKRSKRRFGLLKRYFSSKNEWTPTLYHWGFRECCCWKIDHQPSSTDSAIANLRRLDSRIGDNRWLPLSKCYLKRTRDPQSKRISGKLWYGIAPWFS